MADKTLQLRQVKSSNGANKRQLDTLRTLGLGRIGKTSEKPDVPTVRGAIHAVQHLVRIED
jgi:large subunit ribosomal protein L30